VGVAVYRAPQEWQRGILLFAVATFFSACFGVVQAISTTRPTWLHAQAATMWMWQHVSAAYFLHKKQQRLFSKMRKKTDGN
jgi:hypothetical protein